MGEKFEPELRYCAVFETFFLRGNRRCENFCVPRKDFWLKDFADVFLFLEEKFPHMRMSHHVRNLVGVVIFFKKGGGYKVGGTTLWRGDLVFTRTVCVEETFGAIKSKD